MIDDLQHHMLSPKPQPLVQLLPHRAKKLSPPAQKSSDRRGLAILPTSSGDGYVSITNSIVAHTTSMSGLIYFAYLIRTPPLGLTFLLMQPSGREQL